MKSLQFFLNEFRDLIINKVMTSINKIKQSNVQTDFGDFRIFLSLAGV
jgi:hypothetical protein